MLAYTLNKKFRTLTAHMQTDWHEVELYIAKPVTNNAYPDPSSTRTLSISQSFAIARVLSIILTFDLAANLNCACANRRI